MTEPVMILPGYIYLGIVRSIYDGDTIRCDLDLGFGIWKRNETLRLMDIDTPEVRGIERPAGLEARDALIARILDKDVVIQTERDRKEKWGRYLATVWLDGENINQWLVAEGLAQPYDGGAR